ncbi:unnamed protein product, partial [marine sediment metagenome]
DLNMTEEGEQDAEQMQQEVRKNCRELNGYLCSEGNCALEWLNSSDSYCCPILCRTCPEDITCDDEDSCTEDSCVVEDGKAVCKYEEISPCANNGICEMGEFSGVISAYCPGDSHAVTTSHLESNDCPSTCDDGNPNTGDWYDFDAQECKHEIDENKCGFAIPVTIPILEGDAYDSDTIILGKQLTVKIDFRPEAAEYTTMSYTTSTSNKLLDSTELFDKVKVAVKIFGVCKEEGILCGNGFPNKEGYFIANCLIDMPVDCKSETVSIEYNLERIDCKDKRIGGGSFSVKVAKEIKTNYKSVSDGKIKYSFKRLVDPKFSNIQEGWRFLELELDIENIDAEEGMYWYFNSALGDLNYYLQVVSSDGELQQLGNCKGDCKPIRSGEKASVALGFSLRNDLEIEKVIFNMPAKSETISEIKIVEVPNWESP